MILTWLALGFIPLSFVSSLFGTSLPVGKEFSKNVSSYYRGDPRVGPGSTTVPWETYDQTNLNSVSQVVRNIAEIDNALLAESSERSSHRKSHCRWMALGWEKIKQKSCAKEEGHGTASGDVLQNCYKTNPHPAYSRLHTSFGRASCSSIVRVGSPT